MRLVIAFFRTFFLQSFDFFTRSTRRWLYLYGFINGLVAMALLFSSRMTFYKLGDIDLLGLGDYSKIVLIAFSLLSSMAIIVRRLHDMDKSGWLFLISVIPFLNILIMVLLLLPGTNGANRYREDPRNFDSLR